MRANLATPYNVNPSNKLPLTPILSMRKPLIVRPYINKHTADMQKSIPASDWDIWYSNMQYNKKVRSSIKKINDVNSLIMKIITISHVSCYQNEALLNVAEELCELVSSSSGFGPHKRLFFILRLFFFFFNMSGSFRGSSSTSF